MLCPASRSCRVGCLSVGEDNQGTFRIRGSELQGGVGMAASGLAGSAVVHAEYGDAFAGSGGRLS